MFLQVQSWYGEKGVKGVIQESIRVLREYSGFMLLGALLGLLWANFAHDSYEQFKHVPLWINDYIGEIHDGHRIITIHYLVTDLLMAFFFLEAGKQVYEAIVLAKGSLHDPKAAAVPLLATVGGILGPVSIYLLLTNITGHVEAISGWAIPTATDIAFSYVVGRMIFGQKHPAIDFLLLLAIADDGAGLAILAVFYPQGSLELQWLFLAVGGVLFGHFVLHKMLRVTNFWYYLIITGGSSLIAFAMAGIHPVLGLLPVVLVMPHAETDLGLYMNTELDRHDSLNEMEHWWKSPVEIILFFFALLNSGVLLSQIGPMTWPVLFALVIGKPLGIFLFGGVSGYLLGLPKGMTYRDLAVLGCVAGIGFTVALFVTTVALPAGPLQDQAKVGALLSLASSVVSLIVARILGVQKHLEYKASDEEEVLVPGMEVVSE